MKDSKFYNTVIEGDYCIGCGVCATLTNSPIKIEMDDYGKYIPQIDTFVVAADAIQEIEKLCPFSDGSLDEDELGKELYGNTNTYKNKLGYIDSTYAGYVIEGDYRKKGSSGGFGSWIVNNLLEEDLVDAVIHIGDSTRENKAETLFEYRVSTTTEEVLKGAKSKYYPIEMSGIINFIKNNPKRYVIVGIPCFIKSVRLLSRTNSVINDRIKFTVGLVCGHLKSKGFSEMLGWHVGVSPNELQGIDFRTKLDAYGANQYGITALDNNNESHTSGPVNELFGTNWGLGFFKYKACDYCDDVTAETADITIGDAWLPQYVNDSLGTNIVIVRNKQFLEILQKAIKRKQIFLEDLSEEETILSQKSGLFHRREGLEYRLHKKDVKGEWRPRKRVEAKKVLPKKIENIQDLRILLAAKSHEALLKAKEVNSFQVFRQEVSPLVEKYYKLYKTPILKRVSNKIERTLKTYMQWQKK